MNFFRRFFKNNSSIILFPFLFLSIGCSNLVLNKSIDLNTSFKSFKLNQSNADGNIVFKMKSPQAVINNSTKAVKANETEITFFENDLPIYNVTSKESIISSDGKLIILIGDVFLTRLDENKITMAADKVEWNSTKSIIDFRGNVVGNMETTIIRSKQAIYYLDQQKMLFADLQEYTVKNQETNKNVFELTAKTATWDGKSGKLTFDSQGKNVTSKFLIPIDK